MSVRVKWALVLAAVPVAAVADGVIVDRIYDPYVQPLEKEIEWRSILQFDDDTTDLQKHSLGLGRSLSDRWAAEFYVVGTRVSGESLDLDTLELEFKRQLTEQGQYAFDWGVVFELEREREFDSWEFSTSLISARDFGRWTGVANLALVYEWGSGVQNEFETELHVQSRYRLRESLEPAIELHLGQDTAVLGPALTGVHRFSPGKKLRWDAGMFFELNNNSPDSVIKLNFEYEF